MTFANLQNHFLVTLISEFNFHVLLSCVKCFLQTRVVSLVQSFSKVTLFFRCLSSICDAFKVGEFIWKMKQHGHPLQNQLPKLITCEQELSQQNWTATSTLEIIVYHGIQKNPSPPSKCPLIFAKHPFEWREDATVNQSPKKRTSLYF